MATAEERRGGRHMPRLWPVGLPPRPRRKRSDPAAAALRRVGWRLAALSVGLLCVLLIALGSIIYLTTQEVLLQSLEATVQNRTDEFVGALDQAVTTLDIWRYLDARRFDLERDSHGVFLSIADPTLTAVAGVSPFGATLPDPAAARQ